MLPRVGPGRAIWIALRSRFAFKSVPECLREAEIKIFKSRLADKNFGKGYLVLTCEMGVGKTCLLNTVTSKTPGVIKVRAYPVHSRDVIIKNTLKELTRIDLDFIRPFESAKRVIFWYRLLTFGRSPIVVINAGERGAGQGCAGLTGAVRNLVEKYGLRVIVDGSPNSLDDTLVGTTRQRVIDIKSMTREMIWKLDQLQVFFEFVKKAGLDDIVFAVLGGIPSRYEGLWQNVKYDCRHGQDPRQVIGTYLCAQISAAIKLVEGSCGHDDVASAKLKKLFTETAIFKKSTLVANKFLRPTPDMIFHEVEQKGTSVLIPASNAIEIVLCHGLIKKPTLKELEDLIQCKE